MGREWAWDWGGQWATSSFLKHYFLGFGKQVLLVETGLDDEFENSETVKNATSDFENRVMQGPVHTLSINDVAKINLTGVGERGSPDVFPFNTPALFSVGDSILSMSANCISGWCSFSYSMNDRFVDALDIYDRIQQPNLDIGIPYNIHHSWITSRSYAE